MVEPQKRSKVSIVTEYDTNIRGSNPLCLERLKSEKRDTRSELKRQNLDIKCALKKQGLAENLQIWNITIAGRPNTPYEGKVVTGTMTFTDDYPVVSPQFKFDKVDGKPFQHINVYGDGTTCLDILNPDTFTSQTTVAEILKALDNFLYDPNPKSAANKSLEVLYSSNRAEYDKIIKEQGEKLPSGK